MKNIRYGVFETNSSSSHSITIDNDCAVVLETLPVNENGMLNILVEGDFETHECYGRYWSISSKISYAYMISRDMIENDYGIEARDMLEKVIKEHTGAKTVKFFQEEYAFASIDDYRGDDPKKIFNDEKTLKMFLFNPNSSVEVSHS